jgi:hypothetical protein
VIPGLDYLRRLVPADAARMYTEFFDTQVLMKLQAKMDGAGDWSQGVCRKWLHTLRSGVRRLESSNEAACIASAVSAYRSGGLVSEPKDFGANIHRFNTNRVDPEDRILGADFGKVMEGLVKLGDKVQHQLVARIRKRERRELLTSDHQRLQMAAMEMKAACTYLVEIHYNGPLGTPGRYDKPAIADEVYKYLYRRSMPQANPHSRPSANPPKCRRVAKATGIVCGAEQTWRMTHRETCCRTNRGDPKHTRLQNTVVWMAGEMGGSGQASGCGVW